MRTTSARTHFAAGELYDALSVARDGWDGFFPPPASVVSCQKATSACAIRRLNRESTR